MIVLTNFSITINIAKIHITIQKMTGEQKVEKKHDSCVKKR